MNFVDGDAETWCKWQQQQLGELYRPVPLKKADQKAKAVVTQLCDKALALYTTTHRACVEHENDEPMALDDDAVENILNLEQILARSSLDQLAKKNVHSSNMRINAKSFRAM